jgi:imidazoleglycerol phosphate synthase glutamine amidotransferase subunit HisH
MPLFMKKKILILNYGSGNVKSVLNICKYIEDDTLVSNDIEDIKKCSHVILPGVGSFKASMDKIKKDIDGKVREYGNVYLNDKQIELFNKKANDHK